MFRFVELCFGMLVRFFRGRRSLLLENLALRQQLVALKRRHPRPSIGLFDKLFWVIARRVWINANAALILYSGHQYDQAIIAAHKALELEPNDDGTHTRLGEVYLQKGMLKEALAEHRASLSPDVRTRPGLADPNLARVYAAMGNRTEALRQVRKLQQQSTQGYTSPFLIARVYVTLGETDQALRWLQKGFDEYAGGMDWLKVDPALDPIRSDPRFQDLLRRMNFPQ